MDVLLPQYPALQALCDILFKLVYSSAKSVLFSVAIIAYMEIIYHGSKRLYEQKKIMRYFPLPSSRNYLENFISALSFVLPSCMYRTFRYAGIPLSWSFNPFFIIPGIIAYMIIHDTWFYWLHRVVHRYQHLIDSPVHSVHHKCSPHDHQANHAFNIVYAEVAENLLKVSVIWVLWAHFSPSNGWLLYLPATLTLFTIVMRHAGYHESSHLMLFHPVMFGIAWMLGERLLTPGDHQVHHLWQSGNFALFFRFWDKKIGSYKESEMKAYDVEYWEKMQQWGAWKSNGKHKVNFGVAETKWGF